MIDWQPLLEGRANGANATVGGVHIGDGVDALPFEELTEINTMPREDEDPYLDVDWQSGAVTQESPISGLRRNGGYASAGLVTYEVVKAQIRRIRVRGDALSSLPFKAEADIERLLGAPKGVERYSGWVVYHYPERGLSVCWHAREGRLEHVAIGPVDWVPPLFEAREVLQEWLAAAQSGLEPEWQEPQERDTSQWARYARATALLRAFELGTPQDFKEGRFLQGKPLSAYPRVMKEVRNVPRDLLKYEDPDGLMRFFSWLLVYRMEAERVLQISSRFALAGESWVFSLLRVMKKANKGVAAAIKDTDALLLELIDPTGKQVTERELIERWGWPQVDLMDLLAEEGI